MTEYLYVRNWRKFQHYRERSPPWVKLHWELLASEDWAMLADASKLVVIACILIASRNDGRVPDNPDYIKRVAYLDHRPDLAPLIECGFLAKTLADASAVQADASAVQADASERERSQANARPETEQRQSRTEQSRKKEREPLTPKKERRPANGRAGSDYVWIPTEDPRWKRYAAAYRKAHRGKAPPTVAGAGGQGWHFHPLSGAKA